MSKGYALFQYNVSDGEKLTQYILKAVGTVIANGGTILVATDDQDQREGTSQTKRTVILEFPSREAAIGWYEFGRVPVDHQPAPRRKLGQYLRHPAGLRASRRLSRTLR